MIASKEVGEIADKVLSQMAKSARKPARKRDESFEGYLGRSHQAADVKAWARVHIEGFNAARRDVISAASLIQDSEAAETIDGDRSFRILNGYDSIATCLLRSISDYPSVVQLNSVVTRVKWRRDFVEVEYKSAVDGRETMLRCRKIIVTVPLGVLQISQPGPGFIQFDPEPPGIFKAAQTLQFGKVYRITFRFRNAFWDEDEKLKRAGFLISKDPQFFAWWTMQPIIAPLLTAWCAGSAAEQFPGSDRIAIVKAALASLERILKRAIPRPEAFYFHDWQADPFFRGAYSYTPANGLSAREILAKPVDGTLFFAGEATETKGHSGTVHGAIASGLRAAAQALGH
jgi:monoamine oxidase